MACLASPELLRLQGDGGGSPMIGLRSSYSINGQDHTRSVPTLLTNAGGGGEWVMAHDLPQLTQEIGAAADE